MNLTMIWSKNVVGQPSDSTGGTFKRWILNECTAGHCKYRSTLYLSSKSDWKNKIVGHTTGEKGGHFLAC